MTKKIKSEDQSGEIVITIDNWANSKLQEIVITAKDRRHLNMMLFKDTQGRTRIAMEGEPLLTNMGGPAISYPDGEEEIYIHGWPASILQMPGAVDFVEHDSTGIIWNEMGGYKISMPMGLCEATSLCEEKDGEDTHAWKLELGFPENEFALTIDVGFDDMDEDAEILANHLDMNPLAVFHTMEFGHRLLVEFSHWVPEKGSYPFLLPAAEARVLKQIQTQIDEYVKIKNTSSDSESGFGTVAVAGLAAAAAVGVVGMLAQSRSRTKQVHEKAELTA